MKLTCLFLITPRNFFIPRRFFYLTLNRNMQFIYEELVISISTINNIIDNSYQAKVSNSRFYLDNRKINSII